MKRALLITLVLSCCAAQPQPGPASQPPSTKDLLRQAGRAVEIFWEQFASVNCTESVVQTKLGERAKTVHQRQAAYDYLAVTKLEERDLTLDESRVASAKPATKGKQAPLLVTSGFSTLALVLHPHYQDSYEFSAPALEALEGKRLYRIDFRPLRGGRSPSCLRVGGREYALEWQGSAWLDPATGSVVRVSASLMNGMEDVGLKTLSADVRYSPLIFKEVPGMHWLPVSAVVEAESQRQHWRNEHRFSNYRQFTVSTTEARSGQ